MSSARWRLLDLNNVLELDEVPLIDVKEPATREDFAPIFLHEQGGALVEAPTCPLFQSVFAD